MPNPKVFSRSFAGGEISPSMFGRIDDGKFQSGAAKMLNFVATPQGPAQNRAGFAFVKATKGNQVARLIAFVYSNTQTMVLELGIGYIHFYTMGETLLFSPFQVPFKTSGQVTYTVANPTVIGFASHPYNNGDSVVLATIGGGNVVYPTGLSYGPYTIQVIDANSFHLVDSEGNLAEVTAAQPIGDMAVETNYAIGDIVSFSGSFYYRTSTPPANVLFASNLDTNPAGGVLLQYWLALPDDRTYEIPSPYTQDDLFDIHYVQSADVMTLVHPNHPPMELRRLGATDWTLTPINFGAPIGTPVNVAATASPGYKAQIASFAGQLVTTVAPHTLAVGDGVYLDGVTFDGTDVSGFYQVSDIPVDPTSGDLINNELNLVDYNGNPLDASGHTVVLSPGTLQYGTKIYDINSYYAASALTADGSQQGLLSDQASALNNLNVPGSYNVITWDAVAGATNYYVFKKKNGLWGFIGEAFGTTFTDNNIAPDFSITPTNLSNPFSGSGNYPAAVGYIEQRRVFAGSDNAPQTVEMSNSGTESTFSYSLPSQDTDRISVRVAAREVSRIEHVVPLGQLLLLTGSCEYAEFTANDGPITPSSIGIRPQSYIGSSNVQPFVVNNSLVYCAARGGHIREMGYNLQTNGFITGDLSLRAAHLFDLLTIKDQAFAKAPLPIMWFVSSNGNLLGLTYVPEQQIGAWHQHETQGVFESIASVVEDDEDRLYAVIRRTVNGQTVRYVERMASRLVGALEDCFFVDAGQTYSGAPATTISGLTWLEGCTVAVLADGAVQNQKVVTGGSITLDHAASVVQVGLPYVCDLQTLPVTLNVDGFGQGIQKNINKVWVRVYLSSGLQIGPNEDALVDWKQRTTEPWGTPPNLRTGNAEITLMPSWNDEGQVLLRQNNPLPLTVVDVTMQIALGD